MREQHAGRARGGPSAAQLPRARSTIIPFWRYAATSVFLVILNIVGNIFSCSLVAYAFARLQWPGRDLSFGLMLATMMIPPQVTMIPYFLIIKSLGWYNTLTPLWVVELLRQRVQHLPAAPVHEGHPARPGGRGEDRRLQLLQIYWHVILPLIKPTLACIAIFTFMGVWNDFMGPLIYLSRPAALPALARPLRASTCRPAATSA